MALVVVFMVLSVSNLLYGSHLVGMVGHCSALRAVAGFAQSDLAGFECSGQSHSDPKWKLSPRLRPI